MAYLRVHDMKAIKQITISKTTIKLIRGDITEAPVDAIVNAANSYLQHGGGVAGIISRKGGPSIQEESNALGFVPVGECAVTTGGRLKARFVIHAVGPRMGEGDEEIKLARTMRNVLRTATSRKFASIAVPAISAGIFGFPKDRCAGILVSETVNFLRAENPDMKEIDFYVIDEDLVEFFSVEIDGVDLSVAGNGVSEE